MWAVVQLNGLSTVDCNSPQSPATRCKHAMCTTSDGTIYLLGGRSANQPLKDFWKFDPVHNRWEEIRCRGNRPPALQEHTIVSWKTNLFVFGGEVGYSSTSETPLWIFDTVMGVWRKPHSRLRPGQEPGGRRGHTAVVFEGAMQLYGGYQDLRGSTSELWSFSFSTEQWRLVPTASGEQPPPRHNHSAVIHDGAMWIYGGMTDLMNRGDFWKWDFVTNQWSRLRNQKGPGELHSHSAVKALSAMYIFGGEKGGIPVQELWRYHFATDTWERIQAEGTIPPPRTRHVALMNPALIESTSKERVPTKSDAKTPDSGISGLYRPVPTSLPPKSISMCFGQQNGYSENGKKYFKFRVHPVSRLCSKSTGSDDDEDNADEENTQVNLRSLCEKISSSRLVRSISSSSYSILHNQAVEGARDELERLVEESTPQSQRGRLSIQKSQSSDAVLESDSESSTPQHKPHDRPRSEILQPTATSSIVAVRPQSSYSKDALGLGKEKDHLKADELSDNCCNSALGNNNKGRVNVSRPGVSYEGPLSTVRDVEEENTVDDDLPPLLQKPSPSHASDRGALLIDLEETELGEVDRPKSSGYTSCATLSDLASQTCTPSTEARGLPYSTSDYYAFTTLEESFDFTHRRIAAGFLNMNQSSSTRKYRCKDVPVELKSFTPTHQPRTTLESKGSHKVKERAHSWDRESQNRNDSSRLNFTTTLTNNSSVHPFRTALGDDRAFRTPVLPFSVSSPSRRWPTIGASKAPIEQHHWQLCMYLFGGREHGMNGHVNRQPMTIWKLYV